MISIIIPTYNEADQIRMTIKKLQEANKDEDVEMIVSDGGSADNTIALAKQCGATAFRSPGKGRAAQMNAGASLAKGEILYFLHADTIPPEGYITDIIQAIASGYPAGCFMLSFDYPHWFLKANCWFTRFDLNALRFGDQSLFVTKSAFEQAGRFSERDVVLEDQRLIKRLRKDVRFKIVKKPVVTSARKYLENGVYKTQGVFFLIYFMYLLGFSQVTLVNTYKKMIPRNKI